MKFILKDQSELEYLENNNLVDFNSSPFKEITNKEDLSGLIVKLSEEESINSENLFTLQINVKKVGTVFCLFNKEKFNKDEVIEEITKLKSIKVKDKESAITKISNLLEICCNNSAFFSIFRPNGEYQLSFDEYAYISKFMFFYPSKEIEHEVVEQVEEKVSEDKPQNKEKKKIKLDNPIKVIKEDKYHFLFAVVASFLIGFTSSIAIYDIYLNKLIYIFFFICSLAGIVLNVFIYEDSITKNKFLSTHFLTSIFFSLIGTGLSIGGYFLFKNLSKDKPATEPKLLIIILTMVGLLLLSILVSILVKYIKIWFKKKRA